MTLEQRITALAEAIAADIKALYEGAGGGDSTAGRMMIPIMAGSMQPSASGGSGVLTNVATSANQPDILTLNFNETTQQHAQFSIPFPKRWNRGPITARFRWSHASTTTPFGCVWGIQAVAVSDNEAINQAYGTATEVTDTGGTANRLYVSSETSAMTVAGTPADGDTVFFRVYRKAADAADTLAVVARLHGVDLFITTSVDPLPPDMVSGATMWLDFTDGGTLFSGDNLDGGTPSGGQSILSVADKVGVVAGAKYFSGTALTALAPGANGGSAARRAAGTLQMEILNAFPATRASAQSVVTSTTKLIFAGVKVRAAGSYTSSPWAADALLSDAGGYFGLHVMQSGRGDGSLIATAYNYAASGAERADRPIETNQWLVVTMSQQSGALRCRVNGGAWASVSSAATSVFTGNVKVVGATTLDADIAHLVTVNTAQTDAAISAVEHWIADDLGITPWW